MARQVQTLFDRQRTRRLNVVAFHCHFTEVVQRGCGAIVLRRTQKGPEALGWAGSSRFQPTVRVEPDPRYLWVYGGDERSHFRRLLRYGYGRVTRGETQRNVRNPK